MAKYHTFVGKCRHCWQPGFLTLIKFKEQIGRLTHYWICDACFVIYKDRAKKVKLRKDIPTLYRDPSTIPPELRG